MRGAHTSGRAAAVVVALVVAAFALVPAVASATPGAQLWRTTSAPEGGDIATSVAVSPDGARTYVSGFVVDAVDEEDNDFYGIQTVAYDSATGAEIWRARYAAPRHVAYSWGPVTLAVSPDGSRVYVSGSKYSNRFFPVDSDYTTIAYDASSGHQVWQSAYNGPTNGWDLAEAVTVSPDGSRVYVTGNSPDGSSNQALTIAYDARTGARLWAARYGPVRGGPRGPASGVSWIAASPDGARIYVAVSSAAGDCVTLAYSAATGKRLWSAALQRCSNAQASVLSENMSEAANAPSLVVSPDSKRVYVTGLTDTSVGNEVRVAAFDGATGAPVWSKHYFGATHKLDRPGAIAVSPDGTKVFETGTSAGSDNCTDYMTLAYAAASGTQLWSHRYRGPATCNAGTGGVTITDAASSLAVSHDSSEVYVTGASWGANGGEQQFATVGYGATSGKQLWVARDEGHDGYATGIAADPNGARVYVTGQGFGPSAGYTTIAYATR